MGQTTLDEALRARIAKCGLGDVICHLSYRDFRALQAMTGEDGHFKMSHVAVGMNYAVASQGHAALIISRGEPEGYIRGLIDPAMLKALYKHWTKIKPSRRGLAVLYVLERGFVFAEDLTFIDIEYDVTAERGDYPSLRGLIPKALTTLSESFEIDLGLIQKALNSLGCHRMRWFGAVLPGHKPDSVDVIGEAVYQYRAADKTERYRPEERHAMFVICGVNDPEALVEGRDRCLARLNAIAKKED